MLDPPTYAEMIVELEIVAEAMQQTGERLAHLGGFGEMGMHGREMIAAADIARGWAKAIKDR
jgi:hypothetical protein